MQKYIFHKRFAAMLACWCAIAAFASIVGIARADQLSVEVVDIDGQEFQLLNARIFVPTPTSCDSCPPKIVTLDGIRVRDAGQTYIIPWDVIEHIEKEETDISTMTVVLTDETTMIVELDEDHEQYLSGDLSFDEYYAAPMREVRRLHVMGKNDPEKRTE